MRVLKVSNGIYPLRQAGTEVYTAAIADALVRSGVDVTVAIPCALRAPAAVEATSVPKYVERVALAPAFWWGNKIRYLCGRDSLWKNVLLRLIERVAPDVIHVHHGAGFGLGLLDVLGKSGLPIVLSLHDYWLLCPGMLRNCEGDEAQCAKFCCSDVRTSESFFRGRRGYVAFRRRKVREFVDRAKPWLAANSECTRRAFEEDGLGSPRLLSHSLGIDLRRIRGAVDQRTFRPNQRPQIGFLGSMRPHKGCHILAEAFKMLPPGNTLNFHGSGDLEYVNGLRKSCAGYDVHFHGKFDHADVPRILSGLDLVVVPSIWSETYCLVVQEAMAARKAVIATDVGGMSDRIVHGVNGFLVPAGEPVKLCRQLSAIVGAYPESVRRLDFDRCLIDIDDDARATIDLYHRAIRDRA